MAKGDRLIVLTGATRGIGVEMLRGFVGAGHRVWGCGTNGERVRGLQEELGEAVTMRQVDVSKRGAVESWVNEVVETEGAPELLINNAAVIHENAPMWEIPTERFDLVFDVNVKGMANVLRAFLPGMIARGRGLIINLSSGAGQTGYAGMSGYCATKFAVEGLTQSLAKELPEGLGAIALSPGVINTEMLQQTFGKASAAQSESPSAWAKHAVPYILGLDISESGKSLRVAQSS